MPQPPRRADVAATVAPPAASASPVTAPGARFFIWFRSPRVAGGCPYGRPRAGRSKAPAVGDHQRSAEPHEGETEQAGGADPRVAPVEPV
jgi:hypothetical protein